MLPLRSTMIFSGEGERDGRAIVGAAEDVLVVEEVAVEEGVFWRRDWCHDV